MKPSAVSRLPLLLGLVVLAAGCTSLAGGPPSLAGRTFLSTAVRDGDADRPLVPGTRIRLTFGGDSTSLSAQAGCNHMGGSYRIEHGVLWFEGGGMTEMGCDPARHAQDDWLMRFLGSQPSVAVAGDELLLAAGSIQIRLADERVAEPDRPLVGTLWVVESILDGDTAARPADDPAPPTLQFGADGQVAVFTGCNEGMGTYAAEGATLRFSGIALTKRACLGPAGQREAAVLAVLEGAEIGYEIDGVTLRLMSGTLGLGLRAAH